MRPTDWLLIALLPQPDDLVRAREGWYRVPEAAAPKILADVTALAFYQPRTFGEDALQIAWWGKIRRIQQLLRRDMLPDEPTHRRADEPYLKIELEPLHRRTPPLKTTKARRLLFAPVRWGRFQEAQSVDDLFTPTPRPIVDSLLYQLIHPQLDGKNGINPPDDATPRLLEAEEELLPDW